MNRDRHDEESFGTKVSVIVPVGSVDDRLHVCLRSLEAMDPGPLEILLVLSCCDDPGGELSGNPRVRVLRVPPPAGPDRVRNRGPARARNMGAARARGDLLLFLDADVLVPQDTIRTVLEALKETPDLVALFGSYDDEPAEPDLFSQYRNLLHHYTHMSANEEASTFWSGCGAVRREAFLSLGGFDERYRRPSIEDVELGHRLKRAGARIRLVKGLRVTHLKRWSLTRIVRTDLLDRAVPWTRLILRDRVFLNDLNLKTTSRISVALTGIAVPALAGAAWVPGLLVAALAAVLGAAALNAPLYRFFVRKRGVMFALKTMPLHGLYHLCCGAGFAAGLVLHGLDRSDRTVWVRGFERMRREAR